ncbi:MAG TPA: DedA family protein [Solirubrobacteraceae bacterium]|nr:DedA family protein [Solirubrobacteraceae bacterium]
MFDSLTQLISDSPWTYALIFGVALLDVIAPILPSESLVILAGVLAGSGKLEIALVIVCAAAGAIAGDNLVYLIGRRAGTRLVERLARVGKSRLEWAERQLGERGAMIILVARFIPAGRTAVTLACGTLRMPWRRFVRFDLLAGVAWGIYAAMLGYLGGRVFEQEPLKALGVALACSVLIALVSELWRRVRGRLSTGRERA